MRPIYTLIDWQGERRSIHAHFSSLKAARTYAQQKFTLSPKLWRWLSTPPQVWVIEDGKTLWLIQKTLVLTLKDII